jgi:hypothetical protein
LLWPDPLFLTEKVFWRKVLDIYATSIDYLKTAFVGALPDTS